jgi:methyl-accepting chemotaxis protein
MAAWFSRMALATRVWLIMTVVVLGLAALCALSAMDSRAQQMKSLSHGLSRQVDSAISIMDAFRERSAKGEFEEATARRLALAEVQAMRWDGGTGYLYAFDSNLVLREHPLRGDQVGKSIADDTDARGFHHYRALLEGDRKDGTAEVRYTQLMPKTGEGREKIGVARWYKPWDLHIVTGAYFQDIDQAFRQQLIASLSSAAMIGAVVVLMVWLSLRSIGRTLGGEPFEAVAMASRIAGGDLRPDDVSSYPPDSLLGGLERMRAQLASIVSGVQGSAHAVSHAAVQLNESNESLSSRTQSQASSLEESAASMEEMTAAVKQNAEAAGEADRISRQARARAEDGGRITGEAIDAMVAIADSSKRIEDIVNLIDGIAFQTNLLALNAGVEAARAGEHGRGFAVVASEVRRLAHSSASASKEIKALIGESAERVGVGRGLVQQSADALGVIVQSVRKLTDIVGEVSAASREQSAGVDQVNLAIAQIDQVTQENAALVEEAAAVAKLMESQALSLRESVSIFSLS